MFLDHGQLQVHWWNRLVKSELGQCRDNCGDYHSVRLETWPGSEADCRSSAWTISDMYQGWTIQGLADIYLWLYGCRLVCELDIVFLITAVVPDKTRHEEILIREGL